MPIFNNKMNYYCGYKEFLITKMIGNTIIILVVVTEKKKSDMT